MRFINELHSDNILYSALDCQVAVDDALSKGTGLPPGQYAVAIQVGDGAIVARDPLGCNKLFYGWTPEGDLVTANRIAAVWRRGVALGEVFSCPPGQVLSISRQHAEVALAESPFADHGEGGEFSVDAFRQAVSSDLNEAARSLASRYCGYRFVVCLSGGLDSTIIASLAARHLDGTVAVSFTYLSEDDLRRYATGTPVQELDSASDDFRSASAVATELGLKLLPIVRPWQSVAVSASSAVCLGQDWRDFNAHCATVNLFLAQGISEAFAGEKVLVLTGDLMNEFVCDYQEEILDGERYYRIPNIPMHQKRKFLVRGLDAGDREIGVFGAYGLAACQLFSSVYRPYMAIPAARLEVPGAKATLNSFLLDDNVFECVGKSKVRAQVGGKDFGTLGIFRRFCIDQARLFAMWHSAFPGESAIDCQALISMGRYRHQPTR